MNDYIDDPELLAQLNAPTTSTENEYVTDPALLKELNAPQPGGAAPQFYATGPGVNVAPIKEGLQTARQIVKPGVQAAGQLARGYGNLGKLTTDVAMSALGLPPPVAASKALEGIQKTYSNVQDYLNKSGQFAPSSTSQMATAAKINQAIGPEGLAAAMKPGAAMPTVAPAIGGPAAAEGATFIERITAKFAPMARAVAPVLNTASRVAGPAGLAYNAYEGAQFAREAELGPRLAQGQGAAAQGAFRNMNTQYGAPVSRDQARAVLQSGNERDIAAFGGRDRLMQLAQ